MRLLPVIGCVVVLMACASGCKERGTASLSLDGAELCVDEATHVQVYLVPNQNCDTCSCGECIAPCSGDGCVRACDGDYCTIDELRAGISITPPRAGQYAVVYQLVSQAHSPTQEIAVACGVVTLDEDGTSDLQQDVGGTCCTGASVDAGAAGTAWESQPTRIGATVAR